MREIWILVIAMTIVMVRRYSLDLDAELMVRPLLKDKPRKVTKIEAGTPGQLTLMCNRDSKPKTKRR